MACKACRSRKIKCDRARPVCQNCSVRSTDCSYAGERRIRRLAHGSVDSARFSVIRGHRIRHLDAAGTQQSPRRAFNQSALSTSSDEPTTVPSASNHSGQSEAHKRQQPEDAGIRPNQHQPSQVSSDTIVCSFDSMTGDAGGSLGFQTPTSTLISDDESLLDGILEGADMECYRARSPGLWLRTSDADEYTGPSSGISTISDLGLNWVRQNVTDSRTLCDTIQDIRNGVLNHLRQPKCIPQALPLALTAPCDSKVKQTPDSTVMTYVEAYFDTVQVIFPILDRKKFFSQLEALGTGANMSSNPSWQALLSAVLASGCRAVLSAETADAFRNSGREAWAYFNNALSFESRILHGSTDLMAVQAMAVMTVFAQGLSSPQRLEYTLSSIASRLAQSLALNQKPPPEWNLTEEEQKERNRVFWVVYCLDKSIALRCGRPAVISDDEVSCPFPGGVAVVQRGDATTATTPNVDFFLLFTKLSRICGKVSRMLYSVSALQISTSRLLPIMNRIRQELQSWLDLLPEPIRPGQPPNRITNPFGLSREQIVVLHLSYSYVLCATYRRFTPLFIQEGEDLPHTVKTQIHRSHIEAARSMVLLTKYLDIESFTPAWLVFYYPLTALTTIFVHIVSNPSESTAQSDIALMEMIVGFFGRLEYVTSGEAAFTKTTEFVRQARHITDSHSKDREEAVRRGSNQAHDDNISVEMTASPEPGLNAVDDGQLQHRHSPPGREALMLMIGNDQMLRTTPLATEPSQNEDMPDAQSAHHEIAIVDQDETLYSDLAGLLAPPTGDTIPINWLSDWVSAV